MVQELIKSKRAQFLSLVIVLAVIATMTGGAFLLSDINDEEITGLAADNTSIDEETVIKNEFPGDLPVLLSKQGDDDGDGFNETDNPADCDDNDDSIYPDAVEICNGIDDNCTGGADENFNNETCSFVCVAYNNRWADNGGTCNCSGNDDLETNETAENNCTDNFDNDCDGAKDWIDNDCGAGFDPSGFDLSIYTGDTIKNITKVNYTAVNDTEGNGAVEFDTPEDKLDLSGVVFSDIFTIKNNFISVDTSATHGDRFNRLAKLTFHNLDYEKVPVLLRDNIPCDPEVSAACTKITPDWTASTESFDGTLVVEVTGFSTFNTTASSRLKIFTQADPEASAISENYPADLETYHRLRFFANYTRFPDAYPINNRTGPDAPDVDTKGQCHITFYNSSEELFPGLENILMEYDGNNSIYYFETGISNLTKASSNYHYNISCESALYEPINLSEKFTVVKDITAPQKPTLYPQILLYPDNLAEDRTTTVSGYFGESDINVTVIVLHGGFSYVYNSTTNYSGNYSEYKGDDIIMNFDSNKGENVTFVRWTPKLEDALSRFKYVEFSTHNRTHFLRYNISKFTRVGDDIRIELYEDLEQDVKINDRMLLFTNPFPSGYFSINVTLYSGSNRITVWGEDQAGNEGPASTDWINAPYLDTAPVAPVLWDLPPVIKNGSNISVIGYVDEASIEGLNMTLVVVQGDNLNYIWDNESFESSLLKSETGVFADADAGDLFFMISDVSYAELIASEGPLDDLWVEFQDHNRDYWFRYDVSASVNNPGEPGARIYISGTPLEEDVSKDKTVGFYDSTFRQGWFNISMNITDVSGLDGLQRLYAVGSREDAEGPPSEDQFIYIDSKAPEFNLSQIPTHIHEPNPVFIFNVSDDYMLDIDTLELNISNQTMAYEKIYKIDNITCIDIYANQSLYECNVTLDTLDTALYDVTFNISDAAGWHTTVQQTLETNITVIDITFVEDYDDITNHLWMNFTWTPGGGNLDYYEFALGTAQYPLAGYDSKKTWQNSCDITACDQNWINFSHNSDELDLNETELKMKTGTVYYLTVCATNKAGEKGRCMSSDGIMFIDQSPPDVINISDEGVWTNSLTTLKANWTFEDNESDIVEYIYSIGIAEYPKSGFENILPRTSTADNYAFNTGLDLDEGGKYYFNVKARNGNAAVNYSGSWSSWDSSDGITVDKSAPQNGWLRYTGDYVNTDVVTIQYDTGDDNASGLDRPGTNGVSGIAGGVITSGSSPLIDGICMPITDLDFENHTIIPPGESYVDVDVTSDTCYVFRLAVWDHAGNRISYQMENDTLFYVVMVDSTPPSAIPAVYDDGFNTFDRRQLHAWWTASTDTGSGFSHYYWRIYEDDTSDPDDCNITSGNVIDDDSDINCSRLSEGIWEGNITNPELSLTDLDLTHNYKYYFTVTPFDVAGNNATTTISDGILYIDNAPPEPVEIANINEANESASPYYTKSTDGLINITAYGDLDGDYDIDNCVLMSEDLDYTEDGTIPGVLVANCTDIRVMSDKNDFTRYITEDKLLEITEINCLGETNFTGGSPTQDTWVWYMSCRDPYWNYQTYSQNTEAWFTVDWPEAPVIDAAISDPVFNNEDVLCEALIRELDEYPGSEMDTNITFKWTVAGVQVFSEVVTASDINMDDVYEVSSTLNSSLTMRGSKVVCNVTASDETDLIDTVIKSIMVSNTQPNNLTILEPDTDSLKENLYFSWYGPFDDVDDDKFTLEIQIDNDTLFNQSDNAPLAFTTPVMLSLPGNQQNPDVYRNLIVYEDDRSGNSDIYMYDIDTATEQAIATSAFNETNPQIYGDHIVYARADGGKFDIYRYEISTGISMKVVEDVDEFFDYFGEYIVYGKSSGTFAFNVIAGGSEILVGPSSSNSVRVFDRSVISSFGSGILNLLELSNGKSTYIGGNYDDYSFFGSRLIVENSTGIYEIDLVDMSVEEISTDASTPLLYGNLVVFNNASSSELYVKDMRTGSRVVIAASGDDAAMYDGTLVFDDGSSIYYSVGEDILPNSFMIEDPIETGFVYNVDMSNTPDGKYFWRLQGCDDSFTNTSCIWGQTDSGENTTWFILDRMPPVVTDISPANDSVVAGRFRIYAEIEDALSEVVSAKYTLLYDGNSTERAADDLEFSGGRWSSDELDFLDVDLDNFTLIITPVDALGNSRNYSYNFMVNSATPWFEFGAGPELLIDGVNIVDTTITSDFSAYTVFGSELKIVGPLPAETIYYQQTQSSPGIENHIYTDNINTTAWPEGMYRIKFRGVNHDGTKNDSRRFYVDHTAPGWSDNTTVPVPPTAAIPLTLSINWTDMTITKVNFTYDNENISDPALMSEEIAGNASIGDFLASGTFTSLEIDVSAYINQTFTWYSEAEDGLGRDTSTSGFTVFIESDAPEVREDIDDITNVFEDSVYNPDNLWLSGHFYDANTHGPWSEMDNLTYVITDNCSDVAFNYNVTSGQVFNIDPSGNFTGLCEVNATATDYYGKTAMITFFVTVQPVNDLPTIDPVPAILSEEDNTSIFELGLTANDVDGDDLTWLDPIYNETVFELKNKDDAGNYNFTLKHDAFGIYNITFRVKDAEYEVHRNVTFDITGLPDAPSIGTITAPIIGSDYAGNVTVVWTPAVDVDGDILNYSLEYSIDGGGSWDVIASYTTILQNLSFMWRSASDIISAEENVTLRLNVTDPSARTNSTTYGEFTIDNNPPAITINDPDPIIIGTTFNTDIDTDEIANCTLILLRGLSTQSLNTTASTTSHDVSFTGLSLNTSYNLSVTCEDHLHNENTASIIFEPRAHGIEFVQAYADPSWAYTGHDANITIEIVSTGLVNNLTMNMTFPGGYWDLDDSDLTDELNETNRIGILEITPTTKGVYNLEINELGNGAYTAASTPIVISGILEVFNPVNQTWNVEDIIG